jgi:cell division GTPase FtsZ
LSLSLLLLLQVSGDSTSLTDAFSLADDVLRQGVQVRQRQSKQQQLCAALAHHKLASSSPEQQREHAKHNLRA